MKASRQDDHGMAEQAAEWIDAMKSAEAPPAAFVAWLKESPRHIENVLLISAKLHTLSRALCGLSPQRRREMDALFSSDPAAVNVIPLESPRKPVTAHPERRLVSRRRAWSIAASVAVAWVTGVALIRHWSGDPVYTTKVGEQRALDLEDGSVVYLNTRSRLAVHLTPRSRDLSLLQGEALFNVKHDATRPFRVHTAGAVIEATGTQFNVYQRTAGARVSVIEGAVQISNEVAPVPAPPSRQSADARPSTRVAAGEEANVTPHGRIERRKPRNAGSAIAWRQRRLVFDDDTLQDVAAEFNRYNRRMSILVDEAVRTRRLSGTFDADEPEILGKALAIEPALKVEIGSDRILIRAGS